MERFYSTPKHVEYHRDRLENCLCRMGERRGIVHRVYAARLYDGIRALVAWDSQGMEGNPRFSYHDILEIDVY